MSNVNILMRMDAIPIVTKTAPKGHHETSFVERNSTDFTNK